MTTLVKLEGAVRALAEARSLDEIKHVHDIAQAAKLYAKEAGLGLEAQNQGAEIALRAERKGGMLLKELERGSGGDRRSEEFQISSVGYLKSDYRDVLEDTGLTYQAANRWQKIAELPAEKFEEYIEDTRNRQEELTRTGILKLQREIARARDEALDRVSPPLPDSRYGVIYADPPWKYEDHGATLDPSYGGTGWHYPSMTIPQLCELPVRELAAPDCVLFIWVTSPKLNQVWEILDAWGFEYKTSFVWDKVRHNFGYYNSVRHELLLIAGRGSSTPENVELFDSVQTIERTGRHSEKPEEFRRIIETLYPSARKIELFARSAAPGWDTWGNEVAGD